MPSLTLSSANHSRDLHPDLLGEIISWLPKKDLPVWAQMNKTVLGYVRRALYRSLHVSDRDICRLMKTSFQHLILTKHLCITYIGWEESEESGDVVISFLTTLAGHDQLCFLEVSVSWVSTNWVPWHRRLFSALSDHIIALPSLKMIAFTNISSKFGFQFPTYLSFVCQVMAHPALSSLSFYSDLDTHNLPHGTPKSSSLLSLGVALRIGPKGGTGWAEALTYLDLTQLRHLSIRWTTSPPSPFEDPLPEKILDTFTLPNLTHLYFETEEAPLSILSQFATIQHLTIVFTSVANFPYLNMPLALSGLDSDTLESIRVFIPKPWRVLSARSWNQFFEAFKRFTNLRSATVFFARRTKMQFAAAPVAPMSSQEMRNFVGSMKTKSLLSDYISVIQQAEIFDVRHKYAGGGGRYDYWLDY